MTERQDDLPARAARAARPVGEILRETAARLANRGLDAPRLCAELLLAHATECSRADLYMRSNQRLSPEAAALFAESVERRLAGQPVQHIVGETEFWSLTIRCDARALIPRPETEVLVEVAIELLEGQPKPLVAEIGTGTGCIALALAKELPGAEIHACDSSEEALTLAHENIAQYNLLDRIHLSPGDLALPFLAQGMEGEFDLVISNPPYVTDAEMTALQPEVKHDPPSALRGGADGLDVVRRLLAEVPPLLKAGGHLAIEIGIGQAEAVLKKLECNSVWRHALTRRDGAGIERVIALRKEG